MSMQKTSNSVDENSVKHLKIFIMREVPTIIPNSEDTPASIPPRSPPLDPKPDGIEQTLLYTDNNAAFNIETGYHWTDFMHSQFWFDEHAQVKIQAECAKS